MLHMHMHMLIQTHTSVAATSGAAVDQHLDTGNYVSLGAVCHDADAVSDT